ncbi:MAG TPA: aerolysin family beta-barrel pore-forming toxin, partial [Pseudacidobacterium sp.]|nr:aerolysin family beta-barrel pore-forming toxin [Pseudacidobacterium sp.]
MDGAGGDYRPNDRTTIIFENLDLQFSDVSYGIPKVTNEKVDTLAEVMIDNARGTNDIRSELALEYFEQGTVEAALGHNWQNTINWDFRTEQTFNFGVKSAMFPSASISLSESVGGNHSKGGSANRTQSLQQGQRQTFRHEVITSRHNVETYVASASSSSCVIPFSATATLACSCKVHGFLRWGGGERFKGTTNYHLTWS